MTTSTHAEAARGMTFLYNLNRLNVATSRALSILVCSPALFEPECRTPDQMQMANAFADIWRWRGKSDPPRSSS